MDGRPKSLDDQSLSILKSELPSPYLRPLLYECYCCITHIGVMVIQILESHIGISSQFGNIHFYSL